MTSANDTASMQDREHPDEAKPPGRDDPLRAARRRGLAAQKDILGREGGTWTAEKVAAHLRVPPETVEARRRVGRLIGLEIDQAGYVYPAWQFDPDGMLPGLEETLSVLSVHDPWMRSAFFLSGDPRLEGERPLDELRQGHLDAVRRAASGYGEHGAA